MQAGQLDRLPRDVLLTGFLIALQTGPVKMTQIFRHQHGHVLAHQFGRFVAKDFFNRWIDEDDQAARVDSDNRVRRCFGQSAKPIFALAQRFFLLLALDQLADIAAYSCQHLEHFIIALTHLATKKFAHSDDFAPQQNRKSERALQLVFRCDAEPGKVCVFGELINPVGLPALPDAAGQTLTWFKETRAAQAFKLAGDDLGAMPDFSTTQHV